MEIYKILILMYVVFGLFWMANWFYYRRNKK